MRTRQFFSAILISLIFGFLFFNILYNWGTLRSFPWHFKSGNIALFILLLLPLYLLNVLCWHLVTRALGANIGYLSNFRIWMLSSFTRFIPGGFWQYPGRVLLLSREGVSRALSATCVVLETLLVFSACLALVVLLVLFSGLESVFSGRQTFLVLVFVLTLLFVFFMTNQRFMSFLLGLMSKLSGDGAATFLKGVYLPLKWVPVLLFVFLLQFFLAGSVLYLLAAAIVDLPIGLLFAFVGVYSASWLVGYIAFFAPAGVGVREASIAGLLSFFMPFSVAVVIAVAFRLALFVSEALILVPLFLHYEKRGTWS